MRKYLILQAFLLIAVLQLSFAETRTITGTVTDGNGAALGGATVTIKGTPIGTVTEADGTYSLDIQPGHKVLVYSYVGHGTVERKIRNSHVIDVVFHPSKQELQEVIVTGYANIQSSPVNALEGKVSGLYVGNARKQKKRAGNGQFHQEQEFNTEEYDRISDNSFVKVHDNPLSTFSIDVDAASYSNVRRFLNNGQLPPADAVRTEEMINYFKYDYPQPKGEIPFSINTEITTCPWNENNKLVLVGLQGKQVPVDDLPASNIVFLVDVSGSMDDPMKLPLVKSSLKMLA
ncbi:MAG TPA: von Willebrand factor type A domain-containing protein, partial [Flavisolibacter sp.]